MSVSPKISVVIPAYNVESVLAETIESVRSQSFSDWELIVIDDGSRDRTCEIAQAIAQLEPRIQVVTQPNRGVSAARNLGASLAKGGLIAFLDADDRWLPEKLAAHVEFMQSHSSVGISFARVEFLTSDGQATQKFTTCTLTDLEPQEFLYTNPTVTTSNVVIRREVFEQLQGFDETIHYSEDMELLFRTVQCTEFSIEGIDRVLVQYRLQSTGLSSTVRRMEAGWQQLITKARSINPTLVEQHYRTAQASYLQYLARHVLRLRLPSRLGVEYVQRAFRSDWWFMVRQPRSLAIAAAVYARHVFPNPFIDATGSSPPKSPINGGL